MTVSTVRWLARAASAAVLLAAPAATAQTDGRWTPVVGEAAARLPAPLRSQGIASAMLACAEQTWSMTLDLAPDAGLDTGPVPVRLTVGADIVESTVAIVASRVTLPLPGLTVAHLKTENRFAVAIGQGSRMIEAVFPLRGSRVAIEAAEPLCSKRDMSDYEAVAMSPYSSYVLEARGLRREEIELFRRATSASPAVSATRTTFAGGRSLTFVELCGSAWYYGVSGCNVAIYARTGDSAPWSLVYDAEGADLYLDRRSLVDGWPGIIALPKTGGGSEIRWAWGGQHYVVSDSEAIAEGPHKIEPAQ